MDIYDNIHIDSDDSINENNTPLQDIKTWLKLLKQYKGIYSTATDLTNKKKALNEIKVIQKKLTSINPNWKNNTNNHFLSETHPKQDNTDKDTPINENSILKDFPLQPLFLGCTDQELNHVYTILEVWRQHFIPYLYNKHIPLEPSTNLERETFYSQFSYLIRTLSNIKTSYKTSSISKNERLKKTMHENLIIQKRKIMQQTYLLFSKLLTFWEKILLVKITEPENSNTQNKTTINELNTVIQVEHKNKATYLRNSSVKQALQTTIEFLEAVIASINVPFK